uniref:Cytochrome b n=3 Tax=Sphaerothecum destruens TaxID=42893 RepID=A0A6H2U287_9EUKA|nr:cytochrome b [Sphaerothecum destruens]QID02693.1 cytochrome b [Sphaerothecum destruens]
MRFVKSNQVLQGLSGVLLEYPCPVNISYMWNFGSLLGIVLMVQLLTGIFLAMHYVPNIELAFFSVEHIMRDVLNGWILRYFHANGASMFFILVYLHIGRGLYYGSYLAPRILPWFIGVVIFLVMMITAFLGYVLPWGQMSLWGATVITNLVSAIPGIGTDIVIWLWGGFSVDNATLNRFFVLHFLLPFLLIVLVVFHIIFLHDVRANNPVGVESNIDNLRFNPYFVIKDSISFFIFFIFFSYFVFFVPNMLGHVDNYIEANSLVTPVHIQPEWYFLFAYAILRSIPDKLLGVLALLFSVLILFVLPFIHNIELRSTSFRPVYRVLFWFFVWNFFLLTWLGAKPIQEPYIIVSQLSGLFYFLYFLFFMPFIGYFEKILLQI